MVAISARGMVRPGSRGLAGGNDRILEADEGVEDDERGGFERRERRRRARRRDRAGGVDQAPERQTDQRRRLEQGQRVERADRPPDPDDVDQGQRADQQRRWSRRGPQWCRAAARARRRRWRRRWRWRRARWSAPDNRASRPGTAAAGRRRRYRRPARPIAGTGPPAGRTAGRRAGRAAPNSGNSQGLNAPKCWWSVAGQREDAGADHAVERQEGRAGQADVAAQPPFGAHRAAAEIPRLIAAGRPLRAGPLPRRPAPRRRCGPRAPDALPRPSASN